MVGVGEAIGWRWLSRVGWIGSELGDDRKKEKVKKEKMRVVKICTLF